LYQLAVREQAHLFSANLPSTYPAAI